MKSVFSFCLFSVFVPVQGAVFITGVLDGTLSGATPRAFELYTTTAIADFEDTYQFQYASNTSSYGNVTTSFGTIPPNSFFYITNSTTELENAFGAGLVASQNGGITPTGNDSGRIQLKADSSIVDEAYTNASDVSVYTDSFMYRVNGTGPDSSYNPSNWIFGGNDLLDGKTASEIGGLVPFGTFQPIPEPSTILLGGLALLGFIRRRR